LDILDVNCFLNPPVAIASAVAAASARWMEWSGPAGVLVYLVAVAISLPLWFTGLVAWSRRRTRLSREGESRPE
jgi:hypothetical protein